jgi:hypothetical protein
MLLQLHVSSVFVFVARTSHYVLAQVNDKTKARKRVLVDLPHAVVNEVAGNKKRQTENTHVVVVVLIKTSNALTVNNQYADWITVRSQAF